MIELFTSTRVQILSKLAERPHTPSEIAKITGYSKTTVSYHLSKLSDAGLVERVERGKWVYYRITPKGEKRIRMEVAASIASFVGAAVSAIAFVALKLSEIAGRFVAEEKGVYRPAYVPEIKEVKEIGPAFDPLLILPVISALLLALFVILRFRK